MSKTVVLRSEYVSKHPDENCIVERVSHSLTVLEQDSFFPLLVCIRAGLIDNRISASYVLPIEEEAQLLGALQRRAEERARES